MKYLYLIACLLMPLALAAQFSIIGPSPVQTGMVVTYSYSNGTTLSQPMWFINKGTALTTHVSGTTYSVTVRWTEVGSGSVVLNNSYQTVSARNITVTLGACTPPPSPATGFFVSPNPCGPKYVKRLKEPPPGVIWYWQTTMNGTSEANSSDQLQVTTSGTYFLRAKSTVGTGTCWSPGVAGISVTANPSAPLPSTPTVSSNPCGDKILSKSGTPPNGTQWYWQGTNPNGTDYTSSIATASTYTASLTGTNKYYIRGRTSNGCWSPAREVSLTVDKPDKPEDWTFYYCKDDNISLTAFGYDHTLNWYENNQLVHTGLNLDLPMRPSGVYYFFATNVNGEGCESEEAAKITLSIGGNSCVPPYNHVKSTTVLVPGKTDAGQIANLSVGQKSVATTYYDGLGRPMQTVSWQGSPKKKDVVLPIVYDEVGRQTRSYLPFASTEDDGWYRPHYKLINHISQDYIGEAASFYAAGSNNKVADDLRPLSETVFEASPLGRPLKSYGPGQNWYDEEKYIEYDYLINEDGIGEGQERIIAWALNGSGYPVRYKSATFNSNSGYYPTGSLSISSIKDEEGMETREYRNSLGQVVLTKVQLVEEGPVDLNNPAHWVQTYYLYDDYDNLRFVLAPELTKQLVQDANAIPSVDDLQDFAFQYKYDERQRLIEKHVPGGGSTHMVYDKWDRLVLFQDSEQRLENKWSFTKYDTYNRPIITGLYTDSRTNTAIQADLESVTVRFESLNAQPGASSVYTNASFPTNGIEVLTETYYDNYGFLGTTNWDTEGNNYGYLDDDLPNIVKNDRVIGQVTGGKVKILDTDTWLNSVVYYDEYYNPIQSVNENHLGGVDRISSLYDFSGKVLRTVHAHTGIEQHEIVMEFTYDHAGRLLETWHTTNNGGSVLLARNEYNELGELVKKHLHKEGSAFAQSVDYRYNIRGWLKRINNSDLSPDAGDHRGDLFGMELSYNEGFEVPQYNGNISGARWKNAVDHTERAYGYTYDPMNRLTGADYVAGGKNNWTDEENRFEVGNIRYDHNGNILALDRNGLFRHTMGEAPEYGITDQLSYHYRGNQLMAVNDAMDTPEGNASDFRDNGSKGDLNNPEYGYDANGNMTWDGNKGITVTYNHLNLPERVDFGDGKYIEYTYDATGTKLRQEVHDGQNPAKRTDYVGGMVYEDGQLQFVQHGEGRIVMVDNDGLSKLPEYQYHLKDHLGNVRLTFSAEPETESGTATLETAHEEEEYATFLRYAETTKVNSTLFDHTNNGDTRYAVRLNGTANERRGLAKSLAVMTGDTIRAEVFAKYLDPDPNNWTTALQNLMAAIAGGTAPVGTVIEAVPPSGGDDFPFIGLLDAAKANDTGLKAYLNILLFDEGLKFLDAAYVPVSMAAKEDGTNVPHEKLSEEIVVQQPGYVYIYFSNDNEEPLEVFFDDFTVTHSHSAIVQADDYYPFGMTFNSYRRELGKLNEYLYQGKERSEALGWDDFHARMYSAALGRFFGVDPQNQFASPFIGMGNNPVMMVDPDGELAWFVIPAIVGAVAGGINLATNWENVGGFWEGVGYFGVGFAAGAGATLGVTAAAPAVMAALGTGAYGGAALGAIGGGISGFAMGAGNTWMDGGGFGEGLVSGAVGLGTGAAIGAVTGGLTQGTISKIQGRNFWTGASKPIPMLDPLTPKGSSGLGTPDQKLPSRLDPVKSNPLMQNADDPLNANGMRIGQGDFAGKSISIDNSSSTTGHIFRNAPGHVNPSTAASQGRYLQLFQDVASNPANLRVDAVTSGLIPQQASAAGVQVYTQTFNNGQVWVFVRNGRIFDAGINFIPR